MSLKCRITDIKILADFFDFIFFSAMHEQRTSMKWVMPKKKVGRLKKRRNQSLSFIRCTKSRDTSGQFHTGLSTWPREGGNVA